jgi:hypothetical protein
LSRGLHAAAAAAALLQLLQLWHVDLLLVVRSSSCVSI